MTGDPSTPEGLRAALPAGATIVERADRAVVQRPRHDRSPRPLQPTPVRPRDSIRACGGPVSDGPAAATASRERAARRACHRAYDGVPSTRPPIDRPARRPRPSNVGRRPTPVARPATAGGHRAPGARRPDLARPAAAPAADDPLADPPARPARPVFASLPGLQARRAAERRSSARTAGSCSRRSSIFYAGFPLRGLRWAILLRGAGFPLGTRDATEIIFISWLVNCLVPAKLGDIYRAYLLRSTPRSRCAGRSGRSSSSGSSTSSRSSSSASPRASCRFRGGLPADVQFVFASASSSSSSSRSAC